MGGERGWHRQEEEKRERGKGERRDHGLGRKRGDEKKEVGLTEVPLSAQ